MKDFKNKKCATIDITKTNVAIKCLTFKWSEILTNGELFSKDQQIQYLSPVYNVTASDIQDYPKTLNGE